MTIYGHKGNIDANKVANAIMKYTSMNKKDASSLANKIKEGEIVNLESNFLLEEDFKDMGILISH